MQQVLIPIEIVSCKVEVGVLHHQSTHFVFYPFSMNKKIYVGIISQCVRKVGFLTRTRVKIHSQIVFSYDLVDTIKNRIIGGHIITHAKCSL